MYAVSQQFHEQMRAARRRVLCRVAINYTGSETDESVQVQVSEGAGAWPTQVTDGITAVPYPWASLDGSWILGAGYRLMPDNADDALMYQAGWWGRQLAGADGSFTEPYPTLTVTHQARTVQSLQLVGDSARGEWPVDFVIELYGPGDVLLHQEVVTSNTGIEWSTQLPEPVSGVVKQVAIIKRWSHPGRQAKIVEFFTSLSAVLEGEDIIALQLVEERETAYAALPVGHVSSNEITVRLVNRGNMFDPDNEASPIRQWLIPNRRIRAWLGADVNGQTEWVPLGMFWSTEWDSSTEAPEAVVRARDRLERLRTTTYRTSVVMPNATAAQVAQAILLDAGLASEHWVIEPEMSDIVIPWAWFPPMSHRDALRLLAEVAMAVVYCDRDGRIRIGPLRLPTPAEETHAWFVQGAAFPAEATITRDYYGIGPDDYFRWAAPARRNVANEVIVATRIMQPAAAPVEVYRSTSPITVPTGQTVTVTVQYQQPPVMSAVASLDNPPSGVSITGARYYAWGAEVDIANVSGVEAQVTLVVTGTPFQTAVEEVVLRDTFSQQRLGRLVLEVSNNHLIQTRARALTIADAALLMARDTGRDIELEWRGNPALELGDPVIVVTDAARNRRSHYLIVRQELEWAGYLSARLTGRRLG